MDISGDIALMAVIPDTQIIVSGTKPDTLTIPRMQLLAMNLSETACLSLLQKLLEMIMNAPAFSPKIVYVPESPGGVHIPKKDFSNEMVDTQIRCINLKTNEGINSEDAP